MSDTGILLTAIQARADDRGFARVTIDDLVLDTGFSRSTVRRLIEQYSTAGRLQTKAKEGRGGGLLMRVLPSPGALPSPPETGSKTGSKLVQKLVQTGSTGHVFDQTPSPEGAQGGLISSSQTGSRPGPAHRPTRPEDMPVSGAELTYANDDPNGKWRRLSPTLWEAPNGDTVSIRSMSPGLRSMLRVDENDDGTECQEAVRAIRGILDR